MKLTIASGCLLALLSVGCGERATPSPDVSDSLRSSLDAANLKQVTVNQDRDKGVVTVGGSVTTEMEKMQAESLAKSAAPNDVIANQITVLPMGMESQARSIESDLDAGIEHNLDAALTTTPFKDSVSRSVEAGVVTLTGDVRSQAERSQVETIAAAVPNVRQVVNKLEVSAQRATTNR